MGSETVAEIPSLVVKIRIVPGKDFNDAIAQNDIVVIAVAWLPALKVAGACLSSSWHGSVASCGRHSRAGRVGNAACPFYDLIIESRQPYEQ